MKVTVAVGVIKAVAKIESGTQKTKSALKAENKAKK